jgi:transposase-like protein
MTGSPTRYTTELAGHILQELARGRTLKDICTEPGMPGATTVRQWVTDDTDGFAARYRQARETGAPLVCYPTRYASQFTPEIAERIVAAVTSGRSLTELCKEDGMPSRHTVQSWVTEHHAYFSERYRRAQEIGRALRGGPFPYSPELADRVLGELMEGRTLIDACNNPGMPTHGTVLLWVRRDHDGFAARYREAREIGSQIMLDELIVIGDDSRGDHIRRRNESGETEMVVDHENIRRSELRCENRRWSLAKALPRIYGNRLEVTTKHDAGDGWAELLTALDGRTRGLPSEDEGADDQ